MARLVEQEPVGQIVARKAEESIEQAQRLVRKRVIFGSLLVGPRALAALRVFEMIVRAPKRRAIDGL